MQIKIQNIFHDILQLIWDMYMENDDIEILKL